MTTTVNKKLHPSQSTSDANKKSGWFAHHMTEDGTHYNLARKTDGDLYWKSRIDGFDDCLRFETREEATEMGSKVAKP